MKLDLGIVSSCAANGCFVVPLKSSAEIEVNYSSLVKDRIMIQPDQLVAINTDKIPSEIVWRWIRAVVIEINSDIIVVDDMQGHPAKVVLVPELPLELAVDDEIWACSTGSGFEIHDHIVDGKPAHPERIIKYISPLIEEIYRGK